MSTPTVAMAGAAAAQANGTVTSFTLLDSSSAVAAGLRTLPGLTKLKAVHLSDAGPVALDFANDLVAGALLARLPVGRVTVSGVTAGGAAAISANPRVGSFTVADTAAQVARNLTGLNGRAKLASIRVTDGAALTLSAAQYEASATARAALADGTAIVVTNATMAGIARLAADGMVTSFTVCDTAAHIAAGLSRLDAGKLASLRVSDAPAVTLDAAGLARNAAVLAALGPRLAVQVTGLTVAALPSAMAMAAVKGVTVADTAGAIAAGLTALNQAASRSLLKGVTVSDGSAVRITSAQYAAVASLRRVLAPATLSVGDAKAAAAKQLGADAAVASFTVRDTAANVAANFTTMAQATNLTRIELSTPGVLNLSGQALAAGAAALARLGAGATIAAYDVGMTLAPAALADSRTISVQVRDTWADVKANLAALHNDPRLSRIVLTDGGPLTVDAATYAANRVAMARLAIGPDLTVTGVAVADVVSTLRDGHVAAVTIADTAGNLAANIDYLTTEALAGRIQGATIAGTGQAVALGPDPAPSNIGLDGAPSTAASVNPPLFNLIWDASVAAAPDGFAQAVQYAAGYLDGLIANRITVNVRIGYGESKDIPLRSGLLGNTYVDTAVTVGFDQFRDAYARHADTQVAAGALSHLTTPAGGQPVYVATGQARALGLLPAVVGGIDASVGFAAESSGVRFTYDPAQRMVAGKYDFISVAEHELSHALGRISTGGAGSYSGLDLFRYAAPGVRGDAGSGLYFSIDGGTTPQNEFSAKGNGDWTPGTADPLAAALNAGHEYGLSDVDLTVLEAMGFDMAAGARTGTAGVVSPSAGLSAPSMAFLGSLPVTDMDDGLHGVAFAMTPSAGVRELTDFRYGRDELLLDTRSMPGTLVAFDSLIDGQRGIVVTSSSDQSFGVLLTGLTDGQTAGDLMANHLATAPGNAQIG